MMIASAWWAIRLAMIAFILWNVATMVLAELRQCLFEGCFPRNGFGGTLGFGHHDAYSHRRPRLLRPGRQRPRRRAAKPRDERAPPHKAPP
jgi:hypothetical protein